MVPVMIPNATAHFHQDHEADVRTWLAGQPATGQVAPLSGLVDEASR